LIMLPTGTRGSEERRERANGAGKSRASYGLARVKRLCLMKEWIAAQSRATLCSPRRLQLDGPRRKFFERALFSWSIDERARDAPR